MHCRIFFCIHGTRESFGSIRELVVFHIIKTATCRAAGQSDVLKLFFMFFIQDYTHNIQNAGLGKIFRSGVSFTY
jgi:hypothetical protein